ncbi:efflux RND transporter periplasmic adaptor subunit [bacterium]|nr:efflux RND transporter periplasmic adaptor subunit [bacterium]
MKQKQWITLSVLFFFLGSCQAQKSEFIKTAGVVDGEVITIKAAVPGEIRELNVQEGARVEQGHLLARIDDRKLKNQRENLEINEREIQVNRRKLTQKIDLLKSNLNYWKDQVQRLERLHKKESVSGDKLKKAKLQVKELETSLHETQESLSSLSLNLEKIQNQRDQIDLQLQDHMIHSPVTGSILERFVTSGETVFPGSPLADILDETSLFVETFVEEKELSQLELGQNATILVDGQKGRSYSGTITYFGKKAEFSPKYIISETERKSLLYQVKIRIEESREDFKLGMPVTVKLKRQ